MLRAPMTLLVLAALSAMAAAGDPPPFSARAGLDLAADAAHVWAADARLIYLENDEDLTATGAAVRWGYLFYSPARDESRGYSVRGGKIADAADLDFDFPAPPLPDQWIDSTAALAVAEAKAGAAYRRQHAGQVGSMLLIRGALHDRKPDAATWAVVYVSETEPPLTVVVDAASGKVVRTWRG